MTEDDSSDGEWLHDITILESFYFLACHPQYVAFFSLQMPMAAHFPLSVSDEKKHQGEKSGVFIKKREMCCKSPSDFSLHIIAQNSVTWLLPALREAGKYSSIAGPIAAPKNPPKIQFLLERRRDGRQLQQMHSK
jgi:hypothetical protein